MDFLNSLLPESRKKRQNLQTITALGIGIAAFLALTYFFLRASDQSAVVLFVNNGDCPLVTLRLSDGSNLITSELEPGEEEEIEVTPDITYQYEIDTNSDADEEGYACLDIEPGQLTVPRGSTFTINVDSVQRPFFLVINDTECPEVTVTLWEAEDLRAQIDPITVLAGEEANVEITPDKTFEYRVRMESDIEDDERCYEVESGTLRLSFNENEEIRIGSLTRVEPVTEDSE